MRCFNLRIKNKICSPEKWKLSCYVWSLDIRNISLSTLTDVSSLGFDYIIYNLNDLTSLYNNCLRPPQSREQAVKMQLDIIKYSHSIHSKTEGSKFESWFKNILFLDSKMIFLLLEEQFNFASSLPSLADIFIENNKCSSTCIQSDSWYFFPTGFAVSTEMSVCLY